MDEIMQALRWGRFFDGLMAARLFRHLVRRIYEMIVSRCFILPPEQGWQGNTIRKEAKRPENRVTRFPVEKSGTAG